MSQFDLIIRNGTLVSSTEIRRADLGVSNGLIAELSGGLTGSARQEIDASGLHIFPGLIDSHVHFNEPGRTDWEGFATGSQALAAGGGTLFFDMPLNAHPPTIDAASFDQKLAAANSTAVVDFALWGGLVPNNLDQLEALTNRGVIGFKAFMANSGIDDFPCVDDATLRAGMKRAAQLKRLIAVHAESDEVTRQRTEQHLYHRQTSIADYLDSRPVHAELDAIGRAIELAGETGCSLHIVHVSCGAGVALVVSARAQGLDVSCETCPHYLAFTEEDLHRLGAIAKCAPPLRPAPARAALWQSLLAEQIDTVGSDHSPSPPHMKTDANFFKVWGGISGIQHTLPVLLTEGLQAPSPGGEGWGEGQRHQLPLPLIAKLTSANVARRFKLPARKGQLAVGADADLCLLDLNQACEVKAAELLDRHKQSPYVGRTLTGRVIQTILRGQIVYQHGKIVAKTTGQIVKPDDLRP